MLYYGLTIREQADMVWGSFEKLEELGFFRHWITTRKGGVSKGSRAQLNLADHVGDNEQAVAENRKKVSSILADGANIYLPKQVHGTHAIALKAKTPESEGDCLIMSRPGLAGGILTADCLPVILADPVKKAVALIHAGRKGIFSSIIQKTVDEMKKNHGTDPADIVAGIGPGIRRCCYEVGEEVFEDGYEDYKRFWTTDGKLDMIFAATNLLLEAGVSQRKIHDSEICTSCQDNVFFSHRKQEGKAGRFMTGVLIQK